jgi:hypothetical protein
MFYGAIRVANVVEWMDHVEAMLADGNVTRRKR